MREKEIAEQTRAAEIEGSKIGPCGESVAEKLAREREERKKEALERSLKRQAEKDYFEARRKANEVYLASKGSNVVSSGKVEEDMQPGASLLSDQDNSSVPK